MRNFVPLSEKKDSQGAVAPGIMQKHLHSLITLADFKAVLGFDDREDACYPEGSLSRFCLITATYTIEHYCRRNLFVHKHFERLENTGELLMPLREYPVREVLALYAHHHVEEPEIIEPELYETDPEPGASRDVPFNLHFSPALGRLREVSAYKVIYRAGYVPGKVPADLASACLELAAWNLTRYRGRRIGMTGAIRGKGQDGEHLESSMPENVRLLVEPYQRRTI
jgi:hypothetical protein